MYESTESYKLVEQKIRLAFPVDDDFDAAHELHKVTDSICYATHMGTYFIHDLDQYWLENIPARKQKRLATTKCRVLYAALCRRESFKMHI